MGLVSTYAPKQCINICQNLLCLASHIGRGVPRDLSSQINGLTMNHGLNEWRNSLARCTKAIRVFGTGYTRRIEHLLATSPQTAWAVESSWKCKLIFVICHTAWWLSSLVLTVGKASTHSVFSMDSDSSMLNSRFSSTSLDSEFQRPLAHLVSAQVRRWSSISCTFGAAFYGPAGLGLFQNGLRDRKLSNFISSLELALLVLG